MSKLQELLDTHWPLKQYMQDSTRLAYEKNRRIFTEAYNASNEKNLKHYGNTILVSIASEPDKKGNFDSDFMLEGNAEKIGSALASQMQRHPELLQLIEYSLSIYDNLIANTKNKNNE